MIKFDRHWAMPSKNTFIIEPIRDLLKQEMDGGVWADPFCGYYSPASLKNDLNPNVPDVLHLDALEFLNLLSTGSLDGLLFDPPYSPRQVAECYKRIGIAMTGDKTRSEYWSKVKDRATDLIRPGGKVICCGWNSGGFGINRGFEMVRVLIVPHGGFHNDTIVTVEVKCVF